MAVLKGVSRSRFAEFSDENVGIGAFLKKARDVASQFVNQSDKLFQQTFVEDGAEPVPAASFFDSTFASLKKPTRRKVFTQKPKATVFVKKRMFAALKNNFDVRYIDEDEKIFLKTVKVLLRRKCEEIAFYENLISLEGMLDSDGGFLNVDPILDQYVDNFFSLLELGFGVGQIFGLASMEDAVDTIVNNAQVSNIPGSDLLSSSKDFIKKLLKLREINRRAKPHKFTTWITDPGDLDFAGIGPGTGVIELNLFSSLTVDCGLATGSGKCSLTIEDPYRLLMISEADIEIAIREASSYVNKNGLSSVLAVSGNLLIRQAEILDNDLNNSRKARRVSEINFLLPNINSTNAVGVIASTGEEFTAFTINNISEEQALNSVEAAKALQILTALETYTEQQTAAQLAFKINNRDLNGLRSRVRKEFLGQSILQNMDSVHVFMNSDTRDSSPDYIENERGVSLGNQLDFMSDNFIKEEWETIAKDIVPYQLYKFLRNPAKFRSDGVSIFAGLIDKVAFNYEASSGMFKVNVSAQDNTKFFAISRFKEQPSLVQSEGILDDPLTPFDLDIDESSGLLKDTPDLSQSNLDRLKYLRFDDGPNLGDIVNENKKLNIDQNTLTNGKNIITFQHVPGLIYKWKKGIISATMTINSRKTPGNKGNSLEELQSLYGISITQNPFSGLDSADIISIMITGQPYNYASFLKNSIASGSFTTDLSNSRLYFNFLFDFLERQRPIYGNFIPAKDTLLDPKQVMSLFDKKKELDKKIVKLKSLQRELAEKQDLISKDKTFENEFQNSNSRLKVKINELISDIDKINSTSTGTGLPESISINLLGNESHINFESEDISKINKGMIYKLKRKPEDVRYNVDQNYFIVSSKYDYDLDIQAFQRTLKQTPANVFGAMNSDYKTPLEIAISVAKTINFELFADTNGNIVFRPPEYNKTPLSLMIKMLRLLNGDGTSLAPKFLTDLFSSRLDLVKDEIVDLDLQIKEKLILGGFRAGDFGIKLIIKDYDNTKAYDTASLLDQDVLTSEVINSIHLGTPPSSLNAGDLLVLAPSPTDPQNLILVRQQLAKRLGNLSLGRTKSGVELSSSDEEHTAEIQNEINENFTGPNANVNIVNIRNTILQYISRRQLLLKGLSKIEDQSKQFTEFTDLGDNEYQSNDLNQSLLSWSLDLGGGISDLPAIPKFMKDLIEDDLNNNDGWRSGKRFIIYDDVIIAQKLELKEPEFNRVDITGTVDYVGGSKGELGGITEQFWAGAVDFDSWRQFGHRGTQPSHRPDFSNPETQCAPYAVFKLLAERKKIRSGSVTVLGNEFYQPGDVVYVNNVSMLYYVDSISHQFDFANGNFKTTLVLTYGHPLGEYIPTPLDIIGKGLLSNNKRAFAEVKSSRSANPLSNNVSVIGTLFTADYANMASNQNGEFVNIGHTELLKKAFFKYNAKSIKNIITVANSKLKVLDKNKRGSIEVRSYYIENPKFDNGSKYKAGILSKWAVEALTSNIDELEDEKIDPIDSSSIEERVSIDISKSLLKEDKNLRRFPSTSAWASANSYGPNLSADDSTKVALPLHAIDIVFVLKNKEE